MVTPGRLELPTNSLGNCCSIHLSYGATCLNRLVMLMSLEHFGFHVPGSAGRATAVYGEHVNRLGELQTLSSGDLPWS